MDARRDLFEIRAAGQVSIVSFTDNKVFDVSQIDQVERQLGRFISQSGARQLILDLKGVEYLSSPVLGMFVRLEKRLRRAGGGLQLCSVGQRLREKIFRISSLDKFFDIRDDDWEMPEDLGSSPPFSRKAQ